MAASDRARRDAFACLERSRKLDGLFVLGMSVATKNDGCDGPELGFVLSLVERCFLWRCGVAVGNDRSLFTGSRFLLFDEMKGMKELVAGRDFEEA